MKIGLISDTHGYMHPKVFDIFQDVSVILHAGDIVGTDIITELETLAPVHAVHGNTDTYPLVSQYPAIAWMTYNGKHIVLTHNIGPRKDFLFKLMRDHKKSLPDIVISGHTHVSHGQTFNGTLFLNPGCAGVSRCQSPSVAILEIAENGHVEFDFFSLL